MKSGIKYLVAFWMKDNSDGCYLHTFDSEDGIRGFIDDFRSEIESIEFIKEITEVRELEIEKFL